MSDKESLISKWLEKKAELDKAPGLTVRPADSPVPLSYRQESLWFLQALHPGNPFYHYAECYEFEGDIQVKLLLASINSIIHRHDVLRTSFEPKDGQILQVINDETEFDSVEYDLTDLAASEHPSRIDEIILKETNRPFDLGSAPLFRVAIIKKSSVHHLLIFTIHHLIMDKWSMRLLREELAMYYKGLLINEAYDPGQLTFQYADYAYWQREKGVRDDVLPYWLSKLSGDIPQLELPLATDPPSSRDYKGALLINELPSELTARVEEFCVRTNTTKYTFLLAVYKVLLSRLCSESDIVVGSPFTERSSTQLEQLIGFFDDTLIIRSDVSKASSFNDFLAEVRTNVLEAIEHREIPFQYLVKELNPERQVNQNPFFQTMFIFHEEHDSPTLSEGLKMTKRSLDIGVAKFDLTLYIESGEDGILVEWEYAHDVYTQENVARINSYYQLLLERIMDDPGRPIGSYELVHHEERDQLLNWGVRQVELPSCDSVSQLIEEVAAKQPNQVAVSHADEQLTYSQLDARASVVADHLIQDGVKMNDYVALCVPRGLEMVVGILGIMKAGAAYVPIDEELPAERMSYMLQNAAVAHLLVTAPSDYGQLDVNIINLSKMPSTAEGKELKTRTNDIGPTDKAYLLYTSGSTGAPKGVVVTHSNLLNSTLARSWYYRDDPSAFLLLSSYSFDSSVAGIFWTLTNGGKLILPPKRIEQDVEQLEGIIRDHEVSHTLLLPSLYELLLDLVAPQALQKLKTVIVAGEGCPPTLPALHFTKLPETRLYNEYGPTEATVWASVYEFKPGEPQAIVPIGVPVANTELLVLDDDMNMMPAGIPGQLHIGGKGVSSGYVNNPNLTDRQFVENPFREKDGDKLYKTGDRVSFREDGQLLYHGRIDDQIKIRGHRIELDEIREVITTNARVSEAAVVRVDDRNKVQLAAYLVMEPYDGDQIRQYLRDRLPNYMVPDLFIEIDQLPRLPNGKLDRKGLPDPEFNTTAHDDVAETDLEISLSTIWQEVLNIDRVGRYDNFFELGGDSILSIKLVSRIRSNGFKIDPTDIFNHQTIAELARVVERAEIEEDQSSKDYYGHVNGLNTAGSRPPLFCITPGGSSLYFYNNLAQSLGSDQPVYSILPVPYKEVKRDSIDVRDIAKASIEVMKEIQPHGPYNLLGFCLSNVVCMEIGYLLRQEGEEVSLLAAIDPSPFLDPLSNRIRPTRSERFQRFFNIIVRFDIKEILNSIKNRLDVVFARRRKAALASQEQLDLRKMETLFVNAAMAYQWKDYDGLISILRSQTNFESPYIKTYGWESITKGHHEEVVVATAHENLFHPDHVHVLAERVSQLIQSHNAMHQVHNA